MEGGYSITRRRFSRTRRLFTLEYKNLTQTDKDLLTTFFDDTTDGGGGIFDWIEPASTTVVVVRFTKPPIFSLDFFGDEYRYSTNIELQEHIMPGIPSVAAAAAGGGITYDGDYKIHTFLYGNQPEDFIVTVGGDVEVLVVAAGGGGTGNRSGGGGAGGLLYNAAYAVTSKIYPIVVGAGVIGANGEDSSFDGLTAVGGGKSQTNGGSGGGKNYVGSGIGEGIPDQGHDGGLSSDNYSGGGGGGAGEAGHDAVLNLGGEGGIGVEYPQFASVGGSPAGWFAGGGGGHTDKDGPSPGGNGGGGAGAISNLSIPAEDGVANTGGGAGGRLFGAADTTGGSGIVIIRYKYK
jgi:hypothetical protein